MAVTYETTVTGLAPRDLAPVTNAGDSSAPAPVVPSGNGWRLVGISVGERAVYYTWAQGTGTVTTTTNYSVQDGDETILGDATSGSITITLPATPVDGQTLTVKKIDGSVNSVIVDGNGNTIDGSATQSLDAQFESITVASDGTNWFIV